MTDENQVTPADWGTLFRALENLSRASNMAAGNLAEFGRITDGEFVDLLDKAIPQAQQALDFALGRRAEEAPKPGQWYLGSMNDGLFIINTPPRPSNDHPFHDRKMAQTLVLPVWPLERAKVQAIVDAHNAELARVPEVMDCGDQSQPPEPDWKPWPLSAYTDEQAGGEQPAVRARPLTEDEREQFERPAPKPDGGPAFPEFIAVSPAGDVYPGMAGMSQRMWLAGQALSGICGDDYARHNIVPEECAKWAVQFADALLHELAK